MSALRTATIVATSQQSRFHSATIDPTSSTEIDLQDVTIAIGGKEILTDVKLRLKSGVRYALIGRNGSGKSTLLQALADKLIPGLSPSLNICLVSQVLEERRKEGKKTADSEDELPVSVLQYIVNGHVARKNALAEFEMLTKALESPDPRESQRFLNTLLLDRSRVSLDEARRVASRRSGTRGKKAREEELKAEAVVFEAETKLSTGQVEVDWATRATEMLAEVQLTLDLLDSSATEPQAAKILRGLGFSRDMIDGPYAALSGGWRSRCTLAIALLINSDILLLDEPSNFLDLEATIWLEHHLTPVETERTLVVTSHDQVFLNHIVEETIAVRFNSLKYFEGTPRAMEIQERKERRGKEKQQQAMDKKKEHIEASIQEGRRSAKQTGDENRLRMVKSRQKKLDDRWGLEKNAKGGRFRVTYDLVGYHLTSREAIEVEAKESKVTTRIQDPPPLKTLGDLIHFENVAFRYKGMKSGLDVLADVGFTVDQGGRMALVGANGQGKSTLAKLIVGEIQPTRGTILRHTQLRIGYFSQDSVEALSAHPTTTAVRHFIDHFTDTKSSITSINSSRGTVSEQEARSCLGSFGLSGKTASETPLAALSGGQKVRLALALILFRPPNLLMLDEVTTHVDKPTIEALGKALKRFKGGIILITHDRWFSKIVIERQKHINLSAEEDEGPYSEVSSSSDSEENESRPTGKKGQAYLVDKGKVKLLPNGMAEYEALVRRRLAKRERVAEKK